MNPKTITPAGMNRLLRTPDGRTARGRRDAALLAVMAGAGLRIGEAINLPKAALTGRHLTFQGNKSRSCFGSGRMGAVRVVSLPTQVLRLVQRQAAAVDGPFLFPGRNGQGHLSERAAYNVVVEHSRAAGIGEWVHPHTLRHSYATTLMRETGDLFAVSRLLGHASPDVTARYYLAFDERDADRAADALELALKGRGRHG